MPRGGRTTTLHLTREELWELQSIFEAGYQQGAEGNELADRIADKLRDASSRLR